MIEALFYWSRLLLLCLVATAGFGVPGVSATKASKGNPKKLAAATGPLWSTEIDTGPFIADTMRSASGEVLALKGLAIKLGPAREASVVFDTELLAWRGGFDGVMELAGMAWGGGGGPEANTHYPSGNVFFYFQNPAGLGCALNGNWTDPRIPEPGPRSDPRALAAGSLPHEIGRYRGLFRHGDQTVVHYRVGGVNVLELPALERIGVTRAITRTVNLEATPHDLELLVHDGAAPKLPAPPNATAIANNAPSRIVLVGAPAGVTLKTGATGRVTVAIAKGTTACRFKIVCAADTVDPTSINPAIDLTPLMRGGPALFPQTISVKGQLDSAAAGKSYAVDVIPLPSDNPWKSPTRFGGFDFFPDGKRIAASTWNGDVWIADGIDGDFSQVRWRRFASGLFQTLGLKIVDGVIHTQGRDQITRLHDLNGDGEADHYECFNNDVQITTGYHEFTFDLETDREGNFYFSKAMPVGGGGRGFGSWTPHNGTVMKVSKDGTKLEVIAWGLRAPGGIGVSPGGIVTTGENEGSFVPACKITWTKPGTTTFNGVVPGHWEGRIYHGPLPGAPTDYDRPLCWLPYNVDNSSGSQTWVPENTQWDPRHAGEMLHLSYGKSSIFRVLREEVNGVAQGGMYRLPIDVSAAVMRGRFHPKNGQLFVIGFRGWQTSGRDAFQRIRHLGNATPVPVGLHAHKNGMLIRFSAPLDPKTAEDPQRYSVSKWNYVWGPQYGSGRFAIDQRDFEAEEKALSVPSKGGQNSIDTVAVGAAKLLEDGRSVFLYLPKMTPAMQMELKLDLTDPKGTPVRETIYHTVHAMAPAFNIPGIRWEDIKVAESTPVGERGLLLSFGAEVTDTLQVDQLAWTTAAGTSASVFMPAKDFTAAFQGTLVISERNDFTFSLEGVGAAALQIGGKTIISGELPLSAKVPVTLAKGSHAIYCSLRSTQDGEARIRLMWSSPQFRTEPVPASAFRFIPGAEFENWTKIRKGRGLFFAAQCVRCHQPRGGLSPDMAPELTATLSDFQNIGHRLDPSWLEKWIAAPGKHCPSVATDKAADVAVYLGTLKEPQWQSNILPTDATSIATGAALVEMLNLDFWLKPLAASRKHTDGGLVEFLQQPALHHADTPFPDVRLTKTEAAQIAAYLRSKQPAPVVAASTGNAITGQAVVAASCSACHAPKSNRPSSAASLDDLARVDWTAKGCLSENRGRAPDLRLTGEEIAALIRFRNADRDVGMLSLWRLVPAEYAATQIKALNCTECHSGKNKLPEIALAGEKFDRDWLMNLFAGRHPTKTRSWLDARMPAFASRAAHLSLGLAHKHGMPVSVVEFVPKLELIAVGAKLGGPEGYSCVACHDAGSRKALTVFEGQGPNLQHADQRLRYDYFQRWMHDPQRIAPTTIMPRYTQGHDRALLESELNGSAEKQFEALWQWMHSLKSGGP